MRYNCHSHIFTFRSVFTPGTIAILVNRLSREKWPAFATTAAQKLLERSLQGENLTQGKILAALVGAMRIDTALSDIVNAGTSLLPAGINLSLDGELADLPIAAASELVNRGLQRLQQANPDDAGKTDLSDYLGFLGIGLQPTISDVAATLMDDCGPDTAAVVLMMDITAGGDADDAQFQQQIEDTAQAALVFPGRILPFVAVNTQRTRHYDYMVHALEHRGFVGVKLYPSLGYAVDSPAMRKVYDYCVAHDTPVLLHCNPGGFFRDSASIAECDPQHWLAIFQTPAYAKLRVCFGHFGGDDELVKASITPGSWTDQIASLMKQFPGQVYADISYHDTPMQGGELQANYFRNLTAYLADPAIGPYVLFGSDFHLVRQRLNDVDLWSFFANGLGPENFRRISEVNPVAFLGLPDATGAGAHENIRRQLTYLADRRFTVSELPAAWVSPAIDAAGLGPVKFTPNPFGSSWTQDEDAHLYLDEYLRDLMTKDDAKTLKFSQVGALLMRNLANWPSTALPPEIRNVALDRLAADLQAFLVKKPDPGATLQAGLTSTDAKKELIAFFDSPNNRIADLGPLVKALYHFPTDT
jgi:predicted TIM-barrel fold metal-dependent hydrolase